jgi:sulfur carrier protein ThiS
MSRPLSIVLVLILYFSTVAPVKCKGEKLVAPPLSDEERGGSSDQENIFPGSGPVSINKMFSLGQESDSESESSDENGNGGLDSEDLDEDNPLSAIPEGREDEKEVRPLKDCKTIYELEGTKELSDEEVITLVNANIIPGYQLEKALNDLVRAVKIRYARF